MGFFERTASLFRRPGRPRAQAPQGPGAGDDYWYTPFAGTSAAGIRITADSALTCAAVFRCVTIWADVLGTLPFSVNRLRRDGVVDGGMDPDPDHPLHDVIALAPNPRQATATSRQFRPVRQKLAKRSCFEQ